MQSPLAGGALGLRQFPFLVTKEDWNILAARIVVVISMDPAIGFVVLKSIRAAFNDTTSDHREKLREIIESACNSLQEAIDRTTYLMSSTELREFVESSMLCKRLPRMPAISPSFNNLAQRAKHSWKDRKSVV